MERSGEGRRGGKGSLNLLKGRKIVLSRLSVTNQGSKHMGHDVLKSRLENVWEKEKGIRLFCVCQGKR